MPPTLRTLRPDHRVRRNIIPPALAATQDGDVDSVAACYLSTHPQNAYVLRSSASAARLALPRNLALSTATGLDARWAMMMRCALRLRGSDGQRFAPPGITPPTFIAVQAPLMPILSLSLLICFMPGACPRPRHHLYQGGLCAAPGSHDTDLTKSYLTHALSNHPVSHQLLILERHAAFHVRVAFSACSHREANLLLSAPDTASLASDQAPKPYSATHPWHQHNSHRNVTGDYESCLR